jgi:hypothetical protein
VGAAAVHLRMAVFGATLVSALWSYLNEYFDPCSAEKPGPALTPGTAARDLEKLQWTGAAHLRRALRPSCSPVAQALAALAVSGGDQRRRLDWHRPCSRRRANLSARKPMVQTIVRLTGTTGHAYQLVEACGH